MLNKPVYHFAPEKNWMNDPNGTLYRDGVYYLSYQYNPSGSDWGDIQWAHATSTDLINWKRKGIILAPEYDKGEKYCFSGCAVENGENNIIIYTSIGFEEWAIQKHARQKFAVANRDFTSVIREEGKVMDEKSQPFKVLEWRDPFVFTYGGMKYLLLCGIVCEGEKQTNGILLYKSKGGSLTDWEYVSVLFTDSENIIECPNMLVSDGRYALIYSTITDRKVKYVSGDFDGERLAVKNRGVVDWSLTCYYATNISGSADGKNILYGWMPEKLVGRSSPDGTYSGCLSLPREVGIAEDYSLNIRPVASVESLKKDILPISSGIVRSGALAAEISFRTDGNAEVRISDNGEEFTVLTVTDDVLTVRTKSKFDGADLSDGIMPFTAKGGIHDFDIFTDGSVIEIYVDGKDVLSTRAYRVSRPQTLFSAVSGKVTDVLAVTLGNADIR